MVAIIVLYSIIIYFSVTDGLLPEDAWDLCNIKEPDECTGCECCMPDNDVMQMITLALNSLF